MLPKKMGKNGLIPSLSISQKIIFSNFTILVVIGLCLGMIITGITKNNQEIGGQQASLLEQETLLKARQRFAAVQYWLFDLAVSWQNESETHMETNAEALQALFQSIGQNDKAVAEELSTKLERYIEVNLEAVDSYVDENRVQGNSRVAAGRLLAVDIDNTLAALVQTSSTAVATAGTSVTEANDNLMLRVVAVAVVLILISAVIAFITLKAVTGQLKIFHQTIEKVKQDSDISLRCQVVSDDEVGSIMMAFNEMLENFCVIVKEVSDSSEKLKQEASSASNISDNLTKDVRNGSSKANLVSVAAEELSSAVNEVGANVDDAVKAAEEAQLAVREGKEIAAESSSMTASLVEEVNTTAEAIGHLAQANTNIGSVLDVIRNIADQTNLLALNAAIEAARAGEQGRGFAVVADEVRTLAMRTQASTAEIQALIETLQTGTNDAVSAMERSTKKAESSTEFTEKTTQALEIIVNAIETINESNVLISSASQEQSSASLEIANNIAEITEVYAQTDKVAEVLLSSSANLESLSEGLTGAVQRFKV